ncbi:MAG: peptidylprolyl isomerase [Terrimicrobiaceae bacterium]|nr:peptidylprolyl isomerase [Terrimicrobiaceae bacterium]
MITIIRRHQKALMLVVAVLTIIAFAWLYNPAEMKELGANVAAVGYGRTFSRADIDRIARLYSLALALGQSDLVSSLTSQARDEDSAMSEFIANLIVLRHESAALGIEPRTEQVAARVREVPAFQTGGAFDPRKFEMFTSERLGPLGMTTLQIEEVVRDALRLDVLREAVAGGVAVSDAEAARVGRAFQAADLIVLRFPIEPETEGTTVSEEEARNYFNQNRQNLKAPESLTLEYVKFALPEDKAGAEGKERVTLLQEVAGRASTFAEAVAGGADFQAEAQRQGLKTLTAEAVTRLDSGGLPPAVAQAAFFLREGQAVSDVVQSGDEFFVLRVIGRTPERSLEFEEARAGIEERLRAAQAAQRLRAKAEAAVARVREALAAGKSPAEAAAASEAKVETFQAVTPGKPGLPPELSVCGAVSALLEPGQISNPLPAADGLAAVLVASRGLAEEKPAALAQIRDDMAASDRELVFATWMAARREAAGLRAAGRQ